MRAVLAVLWAMAAIALTTPSAASAATYFSETFSAPVLTGETISGDFHVDRGVLVTSDPYSNDDSAAYTAIVDLTSAPIAFLSFGLAGLTEGGYDYLRVYANSDLLGSYSGNLMGSPVLSLASFTGAPVTLRFAFSSDGSDTFDGPQIDNITVSSSDVQAAAPSFDAVSAAPEPGTWALMLGGVGAMGLMLRSRRSAALTA